MSETSGPEYWWCTVGGNYPEPCTLVRTIKDGIVAYTARCPDPFHVTDKECPLKLLKQMKPPFFNPKKYKSVPVPSRFHGYYDFGQSVIVRPSE